MYLVALISCFVAIFAMLDFWFCGLCLFMLWLSLLFNSAAILLLDTWVFYLLDLFVDICFWIVTFAFVVVFLGWLCVCFGWLC